MVQVFPRMGGGTITGILNDNLDQVRVLWDAGSAQVPTLSHPPLFYRCSCLHLNIPDPGNLDQVRELWDSGSAQVPAKPQTLGSALASPSLGRRSLRRRSEAP